MYLLAVVAVFAALHLGSAQECSGPLGVVVTSTVLYHNQSLELTSNSCSAAINEMKRDLETAIENLSAEIETLYRAVASLSSTVNTQIAPQLSQLRQLHSPGATPSHPATSCLEIKEQNSSSQSGYYWIRSGDGSAVHMYCDMDRTCHGVSGGWMRVANIDMSSGSSCPDGLRTLTSPKRLCAINSDGSACSSAVFSVEGIEFKHVCGRVLGYQDKHPDGFGHRRVNSRTIDSGYVDGVSITHGRHPRKHIWTFAAAANEVATHTCPCMNADAARLVAVPSFVGTDYFCDSAIRSGIYRLYPNNPLWDGQQCASSSGCCTVRNPPWFLRDLGSPTTNNIEMRLCADQPRTDEDIPIEIVELFVR